MVHDIQTLMNILVLAAIEVLPLGSFAHTMIMRDVMGCSLRTSPHILAITFMGVLLGVGYVFASDLLSMVGSFIKMLYMRHMPNTLDEIAPVYLLVSALVSFLVSVYVAWLVEWATNALWMPSDLEDAPWLYLGLYALTTGFWFISIFFFLRFKTFLHWNAVVSFLVGILMGLVSLPGWNILMSSMVVGSLAGYQLSVSCRFGYWLLFFASLHKLITLNYVMDSSLFSLESVLMIGLVALGVWALVRAFMLYAVLGMDRAWMVYVLLFRIAIMLGFLYFGIYVKLAVA